MRAFQSLPIKWKLMLAMLLTSMVALLLLGSALFFVGLLHLRKLAVQEAAALAEIVGGDCVDALKARDVKTAQGELGKLAARTIIEETCLYTADGRLFARYTRHDLTPQPPPSVREIGESFVGEQMKLYRPIKHGGKPVGTIYLQVDTRTNWARLKNYVGMGILVMGVSMLVALIFANRLQRFFSSPILELARVARAITERKDFTQRAAKMSDDETGVLTDAFNRMLTIIQEHDSGSRASHSRLEKRVAERTVELRKVNETLREREERLRAVFEQAMDGFLLADVETKQFCLSNPRMCQMLGYSADELKKLTVSDIHPVKDVPWIIEMFARQVSGETGVAPEVPVRRKDGTVFYADISSRSLAVDGRQCLFGIFRDTTERKQAKEALQHRLALEQLVAFISSQLANATLPEVDAVIGEALAKFGQLTQTDRCFLFSVSDDLVIADNTHEWCAPGVRSQMGDLRNVPTAAFPWYLERLRGGKPLLLSRTADLPAEAEAERRLMQAGNVQSVILVPIRHTGKLVEFIGCDAVRAPRDWSDEDARLLQTIGELIVDTLARLRVIEAMRESEIRFRVLVESSTVPVFVQTDSRFAYVNLAALRLFGADNPEQLLGQPVLDRTHPDFRERVRKRMRLLNEERQQVPLMEQVHLRLDGTPVQAEVSAAPITYAGKNGAVVFARDITERKRAEQEIARLNQDLQRRVTELQTIFDTSPIGLAIADDPQGLHIRGNPANERQLGVLPGNELSLRGSHRASYRASQDGQEVPVDALPMQRACRGETVTGQILDIMRPDGKTVTLFSSTAPLLDEHGKPRGAVGAFMDLTEIKRAETALRRSEADLQLALDAAQLGPWHWNILTGELFWSPQCLALYGLRPGTAMTYERFLQTIHPDDRERVRTALHDAVENRSEYAIEKRVLRPDGSVRWTASRGRCSYDDAGRPVRMDGVSFDITERKETEEALLASEDHYRSLFATSLDAALLATLDGRILAANAAACQMFGLSEEELMRVGRNGIVDVLDPRLRPAMEERDQSGRFYGELTFIRGDGIKFPGEASSVIFRVQKGESRASVVIRDITERKRAEAALKALNQTLEQRVTERTAAAEQRTQELKEAQRVAHMGNWTWEIKTGFVTWSEELYRIFGRDPSLSAPRIQEHSQILTAESLARLNATALRTVQTGTPYEIDLELIRPDGTRRHVVAHGEAMSDADGRVVQLRGTTQDITERKHAEAALRQSEEKFRRLAGHIQDVLYSMDMQTREFRYLSPAFEKVFGYTQEDIQHMGGRVAFLSRVIEGRTVDSDEQNRRLERLQSQPIEDIAIRDEEWWRCKDGTLKCIEDRWIPVYEAGRMVTTEGMLCDISERRNAETALRESEERYHSLVDNLNVGIYRNTPKSGGRFIQANPALSRMFGFDSMDEFLKVSVSDTYQNPADRQAFLADLSCTGSVTAYELRLKKKNGTPIHCSVTAAAHRGSDGQVDWIDGVVEDITERKKLEKQLLEISECEQRRIGQDLHDGLCQHLAGVGFMSKALAQKLAASSPAEANDARDVADLIRQAITDARGIAAGLYPVKMETNGAMSALQELAGNIERMFRVQCVFSCDPPVFIEDNNVAVNLYRIAQEAVNNAIRHGKARHIWITLAETSRSATLTVKDDGKGLPEPFPIVHGIGINIMNHRARMIGGTLDIRRAPEGGTILRCSFQKKTAA